MSVQTVYARKCDHCSKGMDEGYIVNDGDEYYCSDECVNKHYTKDEWNDMYDNGDGDSYWTTWEDPRDIQYVLVGNQVKEIVG